MTQEIVVTPAAVRAARSARGERGCFRERMEIMPPNIDPRSPWQQWQARATLRAQQALVRWGLVEQAAGEPGRGPDSSRGAGSGGTND